jgi:hypothetical protein
MEVLSGVQAAAAVWEGNPMHVLEQSGHKHEEGIVGVKPEQQL